MYAHRVLTTAEALAQIINEHKDESGLTWDQIAERAGMPTIVVKRMAWRGGNRNNKTVQLDPLHSLANAFGADAGDWIDDAKRRVEESD